MHINKKKIAIFMSSIIIVCVTYIVVVKKYEEYLNCDNLKYLHGDERYEQQELLEYYKKNKDNLNEAANFILNRCTYYQTGELLEGITVHRYVKYYNPHKYVTEKERYEYPDDFPYTSVKIGKYKNNYFSADELEVLNCLTDNYCNIISVVPLLYTKDTSQSKCYVRFVFMSSLMSTLQELVYIPGGEKFPYEQDESIALGDGWYYHYTAY